MSQSAFTFRALASGLLSFETAYALFLSAGRFKGDSRFEWVPIDLTILFAGLAGVSALVILARSGWRLPARAVLPVLAFLAWIGFTSASYAWTDGGNYAARKLLEVGALLPFAVIVVAVVAAGEWARLERLGVALVVISVWISVEAVRSVLAADAGTLVLIAGGNYLGVGRLLGVAALCCTAAAISHGPTGRTKTLLLGLVVLFVSMMLVTGGRGPLIALLAAILLGLASKLRWRRGPDIAAPRGVVLAGALLASGIGAVIAMVAMGMKFITLERLILLFTSGPGSSGSMRLLYFGRAWDMWAEHPVAGVGLGAFPVQAGFGDVRLYPHNLFLEIGAEQGLAGLALFLVFVAVALVLARRPVGVELDRTTLALRMIVFASFVNAQVSGDLSDNRFLYVGLVLLACGPSLRHPAAASEGTYVQ